MKSLSVVALIVLSLSFGVSAKDDEIKTTDLKDEELKAAHSSIANEQINSEQVEQLKKEYEKFKENQKKAQELLDEVADEEE